MFQTTPTLPFKRGLRMPEASSTGGRSSIDRHPQLPFALALLAICLQLTLSANTFDVLGIPYSSPGGNPLAKFHPATYISTIALLLQMAGSGHLFDEIQGRILARRSVATFFLLMSSCIVFASVSVGVSGSAVYVESYLSAGVLALVLEDCSPQQWRVAGGTLLAFFAGNAVFAISESVAGVHWIPISYAGKVLVEPSDEFRGLGLYDHPLTGASMTMMGVILLVAMRPRPYIAIPTFFLFFLALLSFGGRTALATTILTVLAFVLTELVTELLRHNLRLTTVVVMLGVFLVVPAIGFFVLTETTIGVRLITHAYVDESARVREIQWMLLANLDLREFLFGMSEDTLVGKALQLGLKFPFSDVENPWLLAFLNLGLIGFLLYITGFMALLLTLWRDTGFYGKILLIDVMFVSSTSNSLGRKSNILFILVACIFATKGFPGRMSRLSSNPSDAEVLAPTPPPQPRFGGEDRSLSTMPVRRPAAFAARAFRD